MTDHIDKALAIWGMDGASVVLAAERENRVYQVTYEAKRYALRQHRLGYRTDAQLASELDWMAVLAEGGLLVPAPLRSSTGHYLEEIDGLQCDLLTWLEGGVLSESLPDMAGEDRQKLFHILGQEMARMHDLSDAWTPPEGFDRPSWDLDGLLGDAPLWDRFWENPALSTSEQNVLQRFRQAATHDLSRLADQLDYGLIHADLVAGNVLFDDGIVALIDFDDGGWGFRLFDIATAVLKLEDDPDFDALQSALLTGYRSVRALDTDALPLFFALRAVTYVGWNITRMNEPNGTERNARFIRTAKRRCNDYLSNRISP